MAWSETGATKDWVDYILEGDNLAISTTTLSNSIVDTFMPLLPVVFLGSIVYKIAKETIEAREFTVPKWFIVRNTILLFIFCNYNTIMVPLDSFLTTINYGMYNTIEKNDYAFAKSYYFTALEKNKYHLNLSDEDIESLKENFVDGGDNFEANIEEMEDLVEANGSDLDWNQNEMVNAPTGAIKMITYVLVALIRMVVFGLTASFGFILFCLGPLAALSSMIPVFQKKFKQWLGTFVVVKLAIMTLVIIEQFRNSAISSQFMDEYLSEAYTYFNNYAMISFYFGIIALYLGAYYITSRCIGSQDAGNMMTMGVFYATNSIISTMSNVSKHGLKKGLSESFPTGGKKGNIFNSLTNISKGGLKDNNPGYKSKDE